jgi:dolichyl-phosphate-mannose-protein mannosyltransferase
MQARRWWDRSLGFLWLTWMLHWIPFFVMGRMLFLHHYLPSFIYACMILAGLFEFIGRILVQNMSLEEMKNNKLPIKSWFKNQGGKIYWAILIVVGLVYLWSFLHFMPLTYGM